MESLDNKIYELVTKPENFEFAWDIRYKFDDIKDKICRNFWKSIELEFKKNTPMYSIERHSEWELNLSFKENENLDFYVKWENGIEYGVYFMLKDKKKITQQMVVEFAKFNLEENLNNKGYICYSQDIDDNVNSLDWYKKILPNNQIGLAQEYFKEINIVFQSLGENIKFN